MNPAVQSDPGTGSLPAEEFRKLAARVMDSPRFQKSPRLRDFLHYVCEETLSGRSDQVREQQIGVSAYGRRPDYNPNDDNIVRVEARRLRRELDAYFAAEGHDEPFVIVIPKGSYVPVFERRAPVEGLEPLHPVEPPAAAVPVPRWPGLRYWPVGAGALLVAVSLIVYWALASRPALQTAAPVWSQLLDPQKRTEVVLPDASLAFMHDIGGAEISLDDYAAGKFTAQERSPEMSLLANRRLVGLAGALVLARILQSEGCPRERISVRHARELAIRDFRADNHILLGSRFSNPWTDLFLERKDFRAERDHATRKSFYRNRNPRPGEQAIYVPDATAGEQFSVLTFLPNLSGNGNVLIIEGTTAEGTEGAWEFLTDPGRFSEWVSRLHVTEPGGRPPYFEVLLKTHVVGGAPTATQPVAHRVLSGNRR